MKVTRSEIARQDRACDFLWKFSKFLGVLQGACLLGMLFYAGYLEESSDIRFLPSMLVMFLAGTLIFGASWLQDRVEIFWLKAENRLDGMLDARKK